MESSKNEKQMQSHTKTATTPLNSKTKVADRSSIDLNRSSTRSNRSQPSSKKPFDLTQLSKSFRGSNLAAIPDVDIERLLREALEKGEKHFEATPIKDILHELGTSSTDGLSSSVAKQRLEEYGKNELEAEPPEPLWKVFLGQFADILVILLIIAIFIAMGLGEIAAGVCIIIIVLGNAILGTKMEYSAGAAMRELLNQSPPLVSVKRDGRVQSIPSVDLVPGDVLILEKGTIVPADIRLIESNGVTSSEAALTGESEPVEKTSEASESKKEEDTKAKDEEAELLPANMVFMACEILSGTGTGVVITTGMRTHMGQIAEMLASTESDESPLETKLQKLGFKLGLLSLGISLVVFFVGWALDRGADPNKPDQPVWLQMLLVSVALTVAAVPEGLPACVTISLAKGMQEMAKNNAIVKKMKSVETLGSATVVCTDKTGTLTTGVMTVRRTWTPTGWETLKVTGEGYSPEGSFLPVEVEETKSALEKKNGAFVTTLVNAFLCCDKNTTLQKVGEKWECKGNMSERPLIVAAAKINIKREDIDAQFKIIKVNPFEAKRKMMSTVVHVEESDNQQAYFGDAEFVICVKGAPDVLLAKCNKMLIINDDEREERDISEDDRKRLEDQINTFSDQAFRVLAVAYRRADDRVVSASQEEVENDLVLTGFFASMDPERAGVAESIATAARAGVRTIMITGDYVKTARAIAMNIGLLSKNASAEKSLDCKVLREAGSLEQNLIAKQKKKNSDGKKTKLDENEKKELREAQTKIDDITRVTDVFARAKPVDKITIVRSLLRQGEIASMTGDGVNDAPALKAASIGVAMGITGTDVAKGAADMVLADDNFCTIIGAIKEGRTIYSNISKFCYFLLSTNIAEVFVVLVAVLAGYPSPLVPTQILWLNLTTDGFPAIALAIEKSEPGIMDEGPRPATEPLIEKVMKMGIFIQTIVLFVVVLGTYLITWKWNSGSWSADFTTDAELLKKVAIKSTTMTILVIVFAELLRAYTSRSMRRSIFTVGIFTNKYMQYSVITAGVATVAAITIPGLNSEVFGATWLDAREWGFAIGISLVPAIVDEITKWVYRRTGFGKRPNALDEVM